MTNVHHLRATLDTAAERVKQLETGPGGGDSGGMDPRVDLLEKRMDRVETKLDAMQDTLGQLPKRWEFVALLLAMVAVMLAGQANLLSAFQSGLTALQTAAPRADTPPASQPIIIQLPPPAAPPLSPAQ